MIGATGIGRAVLIAGPTASGKSALALTLAERHGGLIVNADSMQVYRDLRIITARPTPDEEARAPHRLYGHVDAAVNYSVGQYVADAARALAEASHLRHLAIVVGGTGLYFKALLQGLAAVPPIPPEIRASVRERLDAQGAPALHAVLAALDPVIADRLQPADRTRIARALEVVEATGRSLADWHSQATRPVLPERDIVKLFLAPDRPTLRRRIDARFDEMLARGALDEVRALKERRLDPSLPAMRAHGAPWLMRHLAGEVTLDVAAEESKRDTRRYTKRQFTWFRHQLSDWPHVAAENALEHIEQALDRGARM